MFASFRHLRTDIEAFTRGVRVETLSGDEAVSAVRELGGARRLLEALIADLTVHVDATAAHRGRGDRSAAETCAKALGEPTRHGHELLAAGRAARQHPRVREAVEMGHLSVSQTATIGQTLVHAPGAEADLCAAAERGHRELREACARARASAEDAEERAQRQHAARSLRTWTDADGMVCGSLRLTPEVGGTVVAVIDAEVQRRFRERRATGDYEPQEAYAADALAAFATQHGRPDTRTSPGDQPAGTSRPRANTTVHVVIDHGALVRGNARAGERCEIPGVGPVNVAWVRDLLGEAFLTAVVARGTDITTVAHFGRHINAALRTALLVQGRECDIAGCRARGYLEIDHSHDRARGGPTSLANLGWRCSHHHGQRTRGWTLGPPDPVTRKRNLFPPARAPDAT